MFSLERVSRVDLNCIIARVVRKNGWSMDRAQAAARGYREFLAECGADPLGSVRPASQDVDEVWHTHILDTPKYEKDCLVLFGCFLHHVPIDGDTEAGVPGPGPTTCDSRLTDDGFATCDSRLARQERVVTCDSRQALGS